MILLWNDIFSDVSGAQFSYKHALVYVFPLRRETEGKPLELDRNNIIARTFLLSYPRECDLSRNNRERILDTEVVILWEN